MDGKYALGDVVFGEWTLAALAEENAYGRVFAAARNSYGCADKAYVQIISFPKDENALQELRDSGIDAQEIAAHCRAGADEAVELAAQVYGIRCESVLRHEEFTARVHADGVGRDVLIRTEYAEPLYTYAKSHAFTLGHILRLAAALCEALGACHADGIVHNNVKAGSVYMTEDGACRLGGFTYKRPPIGGMAGKPVAYAWENSAALAPEVFRGDTPPGVPSDIYALGLVLYRLLNNDCPPFMEAGADAAAREAAHMRRLNGELLPRPAHANPTLAVVVLKACAFAPEERYQSAAALQQALAAVSAGQNNAANGQAAQNGAIPNGAIGGSASTAGFMQYAVMQQKGEALPEGVRVRIAPTVRGGVFTVYITNGARVETHECDTSGNNIFQYEAEAVRREKRHYAVDVNGKTLNQVVNALCGGRMKAMIAVLILMAVLLLACIVHSGFVVAVIFAGVAALVLWPSQARQSVKRLMEADALDCVNEVINGYVQVDKKTQLAFADTFLYGKQGHVFARYEEMVWVYKSVTKHSTNLIPTGTSESIMIWLVNGESISFLTKAQGYKNKPMEDETGKPLDKSIMERIYAHNPGVLLGHSQENAKAYAYVTKK